MTSEEQAPSVKERLYEAIDAVYAADDNGPCDQQQIRLGRLSDGRLRLYLCDEVGDWSVELSADNAALLYDQLSEALGKKAPVIPFAWPIAVPYRITYPSTGSSSATWQCQGCGKWVTAGHLCVTCNSGS